MTAADEAIATVDGGPYHDRDVTRVAAMPRGRCSGSSRTTWNHLPSRRVAANRARHPRCHRFLAGMTDRYAIAEYQRFFGDAPELR